MKIAFGLFGLALLGFAMADARAEDEPTLAPTVPYASGATPYTRPSSTPASGSEHRIRISYTKGNLEIHPREAGDSSTPSGDLVLIDCNDCRVAAVQTGSFDLTCNEVSIVWQNVEIKAPRAQFHNNVLSLSSDSDKDDVMIATRKQGDHDPSVALRAAQLRVRLETRQIETGNGTVIQLPSATSTAKVPTSHKSATEGVRLR